MADTNESVREFWERMVEKFTRNVNTCDKGDLVDLLVSGKATCVVDAVRMHFFVSEP